MKLLFREVDKSLLGNGPVLFDWRPSGSHIAIGGYGQRVEEVRVGCKVDLLRWDGDGGMLAIGSSQAPAVQLFDLATRQIISLDVAMGTKGVPTFLVWSKEKPVLVVGNNHGNILIYNHSTSKRMPLIGKHQRSIVSGDFCGDLFALGSDDLTITISNLEGETMNTLTCAADPTNLRMTRFRRSDTGPDRTETFLSYIAGHRTLSVLAMEDADSPVSLQFQDKYGQIVDTTWYKDGLIVVAFELGYLVVLSAQKWSEVNHELFSVQEFHTSITCIHAAIGCEKLFTAGDNGQVKIRSLTNLGELNDIVDSNSDAKPVCRVCCTDDGGLAAISTEIPAVSVYITKLPQVYASYRNKVALLSSLTEVSIYEEGSTREEEYITTVKKVKMNKEFVMVVLDKGVQLHPILQSDDEEQDDRSKMFPEDTKANEQILHADLMDKFMIYSTDKNRLRYFSLTDWEYAADHKHTRPITAIFGEPSGIRSVYFDEHYNAFLYHPSDDEAYPFPELQTSSSFKDCLWETFTVDKDSLVLSDVSNLYAFVVSRNNHGEQSISMISSSKIPYGNVPLSLSKGIVFCYADQGKLNTILLNSHKNDLTVEGKNRDQLIEALEHSISLKRWRNAWTLCDRMDDKDAWTKLGETAMRSLNLDMAIRVFRRMGKASLVLALDQLKDIEEENLLSGHLLTLLGEFDKADELFCLSSQPITALEMRRNIMDWDRALKLAQEIARDQLPFVSLEYATQLEFMGQYSESLHYYESALLEQPPDGMDAELVEEHNQTCQSGMARMLLKLGEVQRGIQLVGQVPGRLLKRDGGNILEHMRLFNEAAQVYEQGQYYDRAAVAYIKAKNWTRIMAIEDKVRSPKVLTQYGKLLLADKRYERAYAVFERARSYDYMISVLLKHLNRTDEAIRIARECRSSEGSRMVAKHFADIGDEASAIEFLVMSQCFQEAYDMALSNQKMDIYATVLEESGNKPQFLQLADYFSQVSQHAEAGKFYGLAAEYETALNHLIKAGDNESAIMNAVEFTARSNNSVLVDKLVLYLMGEPNGVPKDPKFLFHMYNKMGMHAKAAKIALIIAMDQQNRGSYRNAHGLLFSMRQQLKKENIYVPTELEDWLMVLHSYIIVKAGLKATALRLASKLLQAPYKDKLDRKYKRKIETIVRKASDVTDPDQIMTACPQCAASVREFDLICGECKTNIPYCIVTGKHMIAADFSLCASCQMPGLGAEIRKLHHRQDPCPMCQGVIGPPILVDARNYLQQQDRQASK